MSPRWSNADGPTLRQLEVLHAIEEGWVRRAPVTIRELCTRFGIRSTNGINDHLKFLVRKGLLERAPMKSRSLRVTALGLKHLASYRLTLLRAAGPEVAS